MIESLDKIHEHANDFPEVRRHQVEQNFTVFTARIKKDCPIRFSRIEAITSFAWSIGFMFIRHQMQHGDPVLGLRGLWCDRQLCDNEHG